MCVSVQSSDVGCKSIDCDAKWWCQVYRRATTSLAFHDGVGGGKSVGVYTTTGEANLSLRACCCLDIHTSVHAVEVPSQAKTSLTTSGIFDAAIATPAVPFRLADSVLGASTLMNQQDAGVVRSSDADVRIRVGLCLENAKEAGTQ